MPSIRGRGNCLGSNSGHFRPESMAILVRNGWPFSIGMVGHFGPEYTANIPFVKNNLIPLAFKGVPRDIYTQGLLGVYELNRVELLRDVFVEAYERSAQQYAAVLQSLGEPDPFRFKYTKAIKEIVGDVVRQAIRREDTHRFVLSRPQTVLVEKKDQEQFVRLVETEIYSLHEGNFARYRVTQSEFSQWQNNWNSSLPDRA